MRSGSRSGMTLIEVITVVAIVGLLVGILLPAVMKVREQSRRTQCATRLANLGRALHGYLSANGAFPPGQAQNEGEFPPRSDNYYSPHAHLLPYLGELALANAIDLTHHQSFSLDPAAERRALVPMEVFRCPTDSAVRLGPHRNNYRVSLGPGPYSIKSSLSPGGGLGAFEVLYAHGQSAFRDGLSNTIGMSEKLVGSASGYTRKRDFWYSAAFNLLGFLPPLEEMIEICDSLRGQPTSFYPDGGGTWYLAGYEYTWYNHAVQPNSPVPDCSAETFSILNDTNTNGGVFGASSNHKGGVNCLFMDSAVRFISDDVDLALWRALSTRSGGEVTSQGDDVF